MIDLRALGDAGRLPRPTGPVVVLASAARFGYGHVARSLRVARALVRRAPVTAYVVSPLPGFESAPRHPRIQRIGLPSFALAAATAPRRWPITDVVSTLPGLSPGALTRHHGRLLAAVVRRLEPVAVVLDHFPFFLEETFYERALAALRHGSRRALVCAGFRGVVSRTYDRAERARVRRLLERHADLMLVYADAKESGRLLRRHPFLAPLRERMRFVGYVCPPPAARPQWGRGRVLATFGSGVDAAAAIALVCEAFRTLQRRQPHLTLDVVTGGRLADGAFADLVARHGRDRGIRIRRLVSGLGRRMGRYALVVGMGGYNTLTELYQSGTRGIILPRAYPGNDEQGLLARRFRALGAVDHVVAAAGCRPARLARLMAETLRRRPRPRRVVDIHGARRAAEVIAAELERRGLLTA